MMRAGLFVLAVAAALIAWPAPEAEPVHWDSVAVDDGFVETIHFRDAPTVPLDGLVATVDGNPLAVEWDDADGILGEGSISFTLAEMDAPRVLELWSDDVLVLSYTFGSGAGTPVS